MIILTRIARLILNFRENDLPEAELKELSRWIELSDANTKLFVELTDDEYLKKEVKAMMEDDEAANWKKIEEQLQSKNKEQVRFHI